MKTIALIPAYNEEKTIKKVISAIEHVGLVPIVIDDGSTDRTYEISKKMNIVVIKHSENKGKGEALKTGFNFILNNLPKIRNVVIVDADMQYSPKDSIRILDPLIKGEADFVMGYRNWRTVPFKNRLGNFVWRTSFNLLFETKLKDTNCGFMALSRRAMRKIKRAYGGYIIENMMLIDVLKNKLRIKQVAVSVRYKKKYSKRRIIHGIRIVLGCLIFIVIEGIKYRLSKI